MFIDRQTIRKVNDLDITQEKLAKAFIQGAVYSWLNSKEKEPFSVRDLFGGNNSDWEGTPLQALWEAQKNLGKSNEEAHQQAAKNVGWLLKSVLNEDKNHIFKNIKNYNNQYIWIKEQG